MRVHELAKELGCASRDLLQKLHALKADVKSHMSVVEDALAERLRREAPGRAPAAAAPSRAGAPAKAAGKAARAPATPVVEPAATAPPRPQPLAARPQATTVAAPVAPKPPVVPKPAPARPVPTTVPTAAPRSPEGRAAAAGVAVPAVSRKPAGPPKAPEPTPPPVPLKPLDLKIPLTVKDLAAKISVLPGEVIRQLLKLNVIATINQSLGEDVVGKVAEVLGYRVTRLPSAEEILFKQHEVADPARFRPRSPVVTLMGHVDHGKTSLLDAIRRTRTVHREKGGITQHIGAYAVSVAGKGTVTFLDTPGHEAFTAMRARGAHATDVVVLVVAADDGVMPQTIEAVDHARAAEVPIVVAINKCDLPYVNLDRVKQQLQQLGLVPEDWGGKTITIPVSAKTQQGIDTLLEMLLLEAELLELKADPACPARGVVIEGRLSKGSGPVATVLVENGTLRVGDLVLTGTQSAKIRAMLDDAGRRVSEAPPGMPVEILGLSGVPEAGHAFHVVESEQQVKAVVAERRAAADRVVTTERRHVSLEDLHKRITEGKVRELKMIIKSDVQGSLEALVGSLEKLPLKDVRLRFIHTGVGEVTGSDIMLAAASDAIVLGFHVGQSLEAAALARQERVDVRLYGIIYEAIEDVQKALEGLLDPHVTETFLGRAEVRQIFQVSKVGLVAGCQVVEGRITRADPVRLLREGQRLFEGKIGSLKHFKDDAREVPKGQECGIGLAGGFRDVQVGDLIEAYRREVTARKLGE